MAMLVTPENDLEELILTNPDVVKSFEYGYYNEESHPEKYVSIHVKQILDFIDSQDWNMYRSDLRIITLLHDFGKHKAVYSPNGHSIGKGHAELSYEFAKDCLSDENIVNIIRIHDKYIHFYRADKKNKFQEEKFKRVYKGVDLPLLTRFNYADSNNREKISINWFEDKCFEFGYVNNKLYHTNKSLRDE